MNQNDKKDGLILNLLALAIFVIPSVGNIIGPLVYWLMKKDQSAYIDQMGKNVLNFNISFTIYLFVSSILISLLIGIILLPIVGIVWLIFTILAIVNANKGLQYDFPLTIKFLK